MKRMLTSSEFIVLVIIIILAFFLAGGVKVTRDSNPPQATSPTQTP